MFWKSILRTLDYIITCAMWARTLQTGRRQLLRPHRTVKFSRKYNGEPAHKTYFQDPPPQKPSRSWRIIRTLLWSTTCFGLGAYASIWAFSLELDDLEEQAEQQAVQQAVSIVNCET